MVQSLQAIRGMNDVLPAESVYWSFLESCCRSLVCAYGYQQIRLPLIEFTELFKRSIGDVTDIVEKEMYTFIDRNDDSLSLRPEGTAGCVRAAVEHNLLHQGPQRLWYLGPMFRHERPQKGRYRQFHQLGVEAYGMSGPAIEVELLLMTQRFWQMLEIAPLVTLQINTLGTPESRQQYRQQLVDYFHRYRDQLDEDNQRRLQTNPLRILDSKNPAMQDLIHGAPLLKNSLDEISQRHFGQLCEMLTRAGLSYEINPTLVRGLDYYNHTVFEWVTDHLGAQGTVCAGGRYDGLVEQLGGKSTPAAGFAAGLERLVLLLQSQKTQIDMPDIFAVLVGDPAVAFGLSVIEQLHDAFPQLKIETNLLEGSFKSQFKRADKSGARWALVIADDEVQAQQVSLKDLRNEAPQQKFTVSELKEFFSKG